MSGSRYRLTPSVSLLVLVLTGCSISSENIRYEPMMEGSFPALKGPAVKMGGTEEELWAKGYVKLGELSVEQIVQRCKTGEDMVEKCEDIPHQGDPTARLLAEAAARGADAALLRLDKRKDSEVREGRGKCKRWGVGGYIMERKVVYDGAFAPSRTIDVPRMTSTCLEYKMLTIEDKTLYSAGTIWRNDPPAAREQKRREDLVKAAELGDLASVKAMAKEGLGAETRDTRGVSALQAAVGKKRREVVDFFLENAGKQGLAQDLESSLLAAAAVGDMETIKALLSRGARVNQVSSDGNTPLGNAAMFKQPRAVKALIEAGADVNLRTGNLDRSTPLMLAALSGDLETVRVLLDAGTDPKTKNDRGWTAREVAYNLLDKDAPVLRFIAGYTEGVFGYMDRKGKMVVKPWYDSARDFHEGLAVVGIGGAYSFLQKWGYIDKEGKEAIKPQFDGAGDFHEGLAWAKTGGAIGGKCGFIDRSGRFVIDSRYVAAGDFNGGMAPVKVEEKGWGYIDRQGRFIIEPRFDQADPFSDDLAVVVDIMDPLNVIWFAKRAAAGGDPEDGWSYSYIDRQGKAVIELGPEFDTAYSFSEGLAYAEYWKDKEKRHGYLRMDGKIALEPDFRVFGSFHDGLAPFQSISDWGYIDKQGKKAIPARFSSAGRFSEGLARVEVATGLAGLGAGNFAYIDKQGNIAIDMEGFPIVGNAMMWGSFSEGLARIKVSGKKFLSFHAQQGP